MIPVTDVIPRRTAPRVALVFIVLNTAFTVLWFGGVTLAAPSQLAPLLALLTHGGWLHLAVNMLCLWLFGPTVEDRAGHGRFAALYLICGLIDSVAAGVLGVARGPALGSSAAVAGVIGAYFVQHPMSRVLVWVPVPRTAIEVPAFFFAGVWLLFQFAGAIGVFRRLGASDPTGGISFGVLMAALAAGAALWFVVRRRERVAVEWWGE